MRLRRITSYEIQEQRQLLATGVWIEDGSEIQGGKVELSAVLLLGAREVDIWCVLH